MTTKQPGESRSGTALPEIREGITMTIRRRHMAKSPYTTLQGAMRMKELADQPGGKACGNCDRPFSHANRPASLFLAEYENTVTRMAIHSEYLLCWPCCNRAKLDGKESLARVKDKAEAAAHVLLSPRALIDGHEYAFPFGEDKIGRASCRERVSSPV